jgi:protease IV
MKNPLLKAAAAFCAVFLVLVIAGRLLSSGAATASALGGAKVALVNIEGVITAADTGDDFFGSAGESSSVQLVNDLYEIADDPGYAAVVLRVNSPGGSAAGSDEIFRAVRKVQEAGKPVVVSMGDIAASGGYYVSAPADYIYANGATLTGSIGVIFQLMNIEELGKKIGVDDITLHAGEYKDLGNPWRPMTAAEKQIFNELLTEVHNQFIHAVDDGRKGLDEAQVRKLATGKIWTGEGAVKAGLVDAVGDMKDAEAKAKQLAKLDPEAEVEPYGGSDFFDAMFGASTRAPGGLAGAVARLGRSGLAELGSSLYLNTTLRDLVIR